MIQTIKEILNSYWIGAAAFGLAGVVLLFMGHSNASFAMFGVGANKFLTAVKHLRG